MIPNELAGYNTDYKKELLSESKGTNHVEKMIISELLSFQR